VIAPHPPHAFFPGSFTHVTLFGPPHVKSTQPLPHGLPSVPPVSAPHPLHAFFPGSPTQVTLLGPPHV